MKINQYSFLHGAATLLALAIMACTPNQTFASDSSIAVDETSVSQTAPSIGSHNLVMSCNDTLLTSTTLAGPATLTGLVSARAAPAPTFAVTGPQGAGR